MWSAICAATTKVKGASRGDSAGQGPGPARACRFGGGVATETCHSVVGFVPGGQRVAHHRWQADRRRCPGAGHRRARRGPASAARACSGTLRCPRGSRGRVRTGRPEKPADRGPGVPRSFHAGQGFPCVRARGRRCRHRVGGALCPLRHAGRGIRPGSIPGAAHSNRIMAGYRRLPACLCRSGAAFLKAELRKVLLGVGG